MRIGKPNRWTWAVAALVLMPLCLAATEGRCERKYLVYDVGVTNSDTPDVHVDNDGTVVGSYWVSGRGHQPFRYTPAGGRVLITAPFPTESWVYVNGTNDHGDFAGHYSSGPGLRGYYLEKNHASKIVLLCPGFDTGTATDINTSLEVAGTCYDAAYKSRAFVYTRPSFDYVFSFFNVDTWAYCINDSGQVGAGKAGTVPDARIALRFTPPSTYEEVPLPADTEARVHDINNAGTMVGWYTTIGGGANGSFLYEGTTRSFLSHGTWNRIYARAINGAGEVVGNYASPSVPYPGRAFIRSASPVDYEDLNDARLTVVEDDATWVLLDAHDINDQGWIVGEGYKTDTPSQARYFLLVPDRMTPGPTWTLLLCALALAVIGGGVLLKRARHSKTAR